MTREFLVIQVVFLSPRHTSSSDETIEIEIGQIPGCISSGDSDDTIEIDVVGEIPGHIQLVGVQWKQLKY